MFKVGDVVYCIDKKGAHHGYSLNSDFHKIIAIPNVYHIKVKECSYNVIKGRFVSTIKDNKLNRKLYPEYKKVGDYLVQNVDQK